MEKLYRAQKCSIFWASKSRVKEGLGPRAPLDPHLIRVLSNKLKILMTES